VPTPVASIEVMLRFPGRFLVKDEAQFTEEIEDLLHEVGATLRKNIDVEIDHDSAYLYFDIIGTNNVNAAFYIEELTRMRKLSILNSFVDASTSHFILHPSCPTTTQDKIIFEECKIPLFSNMLILRYAFFTIVIIAIALPLLYQIRKWRGGEEDYHEIFHSRFIIIIRHNNNNNNS